MRHRPGQTLCGDGQDEYGQPRWPIERQLAADEILTIVIADGVERCAVNEGCLGLVDLHASLLLLAFDLVECQIGLVPLQSVYRLGQLKRSVHCFVTPRRARVAELTCLLHRLD